LPSCRQTVTTGVATDRQPNAKIIPTHWGLEIYSARDLAFLLATHASLALVAAHTRQSLAGAEDTVGNLRRALDSRTVIGQATARDVTDDPKTTTALAR
jgi:hypothetical protein